MRKISVSAAVNDDQMLVRCLAASPDIVAGEVGLNTYRGFDSAGEALNTAVDDTDADIVVLVHQDVYLPRGFVRQLHGSITTVERIDPAWAVLGQVGITRQRVVVGAAWSSGRGKIVGSAVATPVQVEALDEMILVVRRASGVRFDTDLPGFHMYGMDIVQTAQRLGMPSFVVPITAIHFSRPVTGLGGAYSDAYRYLQRKYRSSLPIPTLIADLETLPFRLWLQNFRLRWQARGRSARLDPSGDPRAIAQRLGYE
jgi:hypothetical protein